MAHDTLCGCGYCRDRRSSERITGLAKGLRTAKARIAELEAKPCEVCSNDPQLAEIAKRMGMRGDIGAAEIHRLNEQVKRITGERATLEAENAELQGEVERRKAGESNINHDVWVRLTDRGRAILRDQHDELYSGLAKPFTYAPKSEDEGGWSKWQLWCLMQELGGHCVMGLPTPFETDIRFIAPVSREVPERLSEHGLEEE